MHASLRLLPAGAAALIAACGPSDRVATANNTTVLTEATAVTPVPTSNASAAPTRDLTGRWIGVEGMFLDITEGGTPGQYRLTMQWDLDHRGRFAGSADGNGIAFERDGRLEVLRPSDGDATGLKYLAGKKDCLTVKSGEGYCRG